MKNDNITRERLVSLILQRLEASELALKDAFSVSIGEVGTRYCSVDDLLPIEIATLIFEKFPEPRNMRLMSSFREKKYTSKSFDSFDQLIADVTFALQDPKIIAVVERITGIREQIPDQTLYAGGLSAMVKGHFLGPHIDNSHDGSRQCYRTLNLLYYVTPDWSLECGGNLELWDGKVLKSATIESRFNRLAIMETTTTSWHSVSPVKVDRVRLCVSNYYFSPVSPTGVDYFNVTSFSARPEQSLLRILAKCDNKLRQALRLFAPTGVGKKDVYTGGKG
jgi:Rps23 Pro-64 3,4-dihydroxylase Tpa1-like proline 4-hydroxylase